MGPSRLSLLLLLVLPLLLGLQRGGYVRAFEVDEAGSDEGGASSALLITWREMVDSVQTMTRKVQQSVEETTKELEVQMQAFHARNLAMFELMKQSHEASSTGWRDAIERQTEIFKVRVNRALRSVSSSLQPTERFTLLHYTDSLTLPRLYRVLRAKEQVESLGHRYALLYISRPDADAADEALVAQTMIRQLLPSNFSMHVVNLVGDKNVSLANTLVAAVREWYGQQHQELNQQDEDLSRLAQKEDGLDRDEGAVGDSGDLVWVASLEMDWLGSLPQTLHQLGQGRGSANPTFRYTPQFVGVGCVSSGAAGSKNSTASAAANAAGEGAPEANAARDVATKTEKKRSTHIIHRLVSTLRQLPLLRFLRWVLNLLLSRRSALSSEEKEDPLRDRDFCYPDLWRVSGHFLRSSTLLQANKSTTVVDLFNEAKSAGIVQDATAYGLEAGLLSADSFAPPHCSHGVAAEATAQTCQLGTIDRDEWSAAKEQFRLMRITAKSGIVYAPPGVLIRDADRHDFELHV